MTQTTTTAATAANDFTPSHYVRLLKVAETLTGASRDEVLEIADELRINSMADVEMDAYRTGNISRETLVDRLDELAGSDEGLRAWFRTHSRFGLAWYDDSAELLEGGSNTCSADGILTALDSLLGEGEAA